MMASFAVEIATRSTYSSIDSEKVMVRGQSARLLFVGLALGPAAGAALARTVAGLLHGVSASDPVTFGGVAIALGAASLLATLLPALRALRADPLLALRAE